MRHQQWKAASDNSLASWQFCREPQHFDGSVLHRKLGQIHRLPLQSRFVCSDEHEGIMHSAREQGITCRLRVTHWSTDVVHHNVRSSGWPWTPNAWVPPLVASWKWLAADPKLLIVGSWRSILCSYPHALVRHQGARNLLGHVEHCTQPGRLHCTHPGWHCCTLPRLEVG